MSLDKVCAMSQKFRAEVDNDKIIKQVFEVAKNLEGVIRQTGNHDDKFRDWLRIEFRRISSKQYGTV